MPRPVGTSLILLLVMLGIAGCGPSDPEQSSANQKFIEANELLAKGQTNEALAALDESIDAGPTLWAYRARAKLHAQVANDDKARADCDAGLKLMPDDQDLLWIKGELSKPAAERFQGKFKTAPSSNR